MSLAKVRRMHESIRQTAAELIDGFVDAGRCDFTHDYARVFPLRIFMSLVDLAIADAERIRHSAECMTRPNQPIPFRSVVNTSELQSIMPIPYAFLRLKKKNTITISS